MTTGLGLLSDCQKEQAYITATFPLTSPEPITQEQVRGGAGILCRAEPHGLRGPALAAVAWITTSSSLWPLPPAQTMQQVDKFVAGKPADLPTKG